MVPKFTAVITLKDKADSENGLDVNITFDPPVDEKSYKEQFNKSPTLFACGAITETLNNLMASDDDIGAQKQECCGGGAEGGCCDAAPAPVPPQDPNG